MTDKLRIHTSRADNHTSLNPTPHDSNEVQPEVKASEIEMANTSDGRAPGQAGGE